MSGNGETLCSGRQFLISYKSVECFDSETGTLFSQPPLISFKHDKNIGNFLVRISFPTND